MQGRAPKPTVLKLLDGERHRKRLNDDEPRPRDAMPVCPEGTDPAVAAIWDYTVRELVHMKILTAIDRDALLTYCEAVVNHRKASALVHDYLIDSYGCKNPALAVQKDAADQIRRFAQEFGLTPSARTRIRTMEAGGHAPAEEDNPFAVGG